MHVDFTFHFWTAIGYFGSFCTACTFLVAVYRQVKKLVDAVVVKVNEHDEMYGWYAMRVKPKQKTNGLALRIH
jgi:hypothetical protein